MRQLLPRRFGTVVSILVLGLGSALTGCLDDDANEVPPLAQADSEAGIIRVVYPDRSLPDAPEVATVDGARVAVFLDSVTETDGDVTAALRVSVRGLDPVPVTLVEDAAETVGGVTITLVHGYATDDPADETADVKLTAG